MADKQILNQKKKPNRGKRVIIKSKIFQFTSKI